MDTNYIPDDKQKIMKQFASVFFPILIFIISCKSPNNKNATLLSHRQTAVVSDTNTKKEKKPDNFIIDNTYNQDNGPVYMYCDIMPEFPGGETAFIEYMRKNIHYPEAAVAEKKEGRVVVKFIINPKGEASDVEILRKQRPDMNNECLRVVKSMPEWKPGMLDKKPVSVSYNITVRFLLNRSENLNGIYILPSKTGKVQK